MIIILAFKISGFNIKPALDEVYKFGWKLQMNKNYNLDTGNELQVSVFYDSSITISDGRLIPLPSNKIKYSITFFIEIINDSKIIFEVFTGDKLKEGASFDNLIRSKFEKLAESEGWTFKQMQIDDGLEKKKYDTAPTVKGIVIVH